MTVGKNTITIDDDDDDFGFQAIDSVQVRAETEAETERYKTKLNKLYKIIMPFLENLRKNPEKDMIHWPNRDKKIENFIKKINKIVEE